MKFVTIGHLDYKERLNHLPKEWIQEKLIISPEFNFNKISGHFISLKLTAQEMVELSREKVRQSILEAALFAQNKFNVELVQLGAFTTSVTKGGVWLTEQKEYMGFVNHGDSYTAAVTCQAVRKALNLFEKKSSDLTLAIVGAYGVIGEALSKILVPQFSNSILIGRKKYKFKKLEKILKGKFKTTTDLETQKADIIITATSHPKALLNSDHLKKNAIVVDVSQPPNLLKEVCQNRPDIFRIDGGYVNFIKELQIPLPGIPDGKLFACIAEVIMQALENERENHVGSIDLNHMHKTEKWGNKYGFTLNELTNFGKTIS